MGMRTVFLYLLFSFIYKGLVAQDAGKAQLKVYTFLQTECPISQNAIATLNGLAAAFPSVKFISVFTSWDNQKQIQEFKKKYNLQAIVVHDKRHRLVSKLHAMVTPEVVVVAKKATIVYRGAIDNSYTSLGNRRQNGVEVYLKNVLQSYFTGTRISPTQTKAIGCKIEPISK